MALIVLNQCTFINGAGPKWKLLPSLSPLTIIRGSRLSYEGKYKFDPLKRPSKNLFFELSKELAFALMSKSKFADSDCDDRCDLKRQSTWPSKEGQKTKNKWLPIWNSAMATLFIITTGESMTLLVYGCALLCLFYQACMWFINLNRKPV